MKFYPINIALQERLHELKRDLFSAMNLCDLLHSGLKLELKMGPLLAHVNAHLTTSTNAIPRSLPLNGPSPNLIEHFITLDPQNHKFYVGKKC